MERTEEQVHRTDDDRAITFDSVRADTSAEAISTVLSESLESDWAQADVIHAEGTVYVVRLSKEQDWDPDF